MKKLHLLCAVAVIVSLLSGCAEMNRAPSPAPSASPVMDRILSRGELKVGMSGDMPPLNMLNKEDKIIGLDADLAAMVAEAMGVKLSVQKIAFAGLLPALESGSIDLIISNMTMTPDRNLKVAFVGPYFTSGKGLLTKNSTLTQAKKFADINNPRFTFVALKGSTSEAVTRAGAAQARLLTVGTENEGVQMVIEGKADAMLADFPICVVAAYRNQGSGLVPVAAPLTYEPIGIAVPKGDPQLVNWLDNFVKSVEKAGYMKDLAAKWFDKPTWVPQMK
ncbi:MAG: transporter substrate-binding domain-containing protein [Deltaproteobacteria bacterium]|nr:transporter substrate-binding domain-containing protein [Deltaproteobacteria bacterium]